MTADQSKLSRDIFRSLVQGDLARLLVQLYDPKNLHVKNEHGLGLLHAACETPEVPWRAEIFAHLMAAGLDPVIPGPNKETVLHSLARAPSAKILTAILEAGGNPFMLDQFGRSPLHGYAATGWTEGCETLLQHVGPRAGLLCNLTDMNHATALHLSVRHPALGLILVSYGADPRITDQSGKTPIDMCADIPGADVLRAAMVGRARTMDREDALRSNALREESGNDTLARVDFAKAFLLALATKPAQKVKPS